MKMDKVYCVECSFYKCIYNTVYEGYIKEVEYNVCKCDRAWKILDTPLKQVQTAKCEDLNANNNCVFFKSKE